MLCDELTWVVHIAGGEGAFEAIAYSLPYDLPGTFRADGSLAILAATN
jgi:hypothetical protein